MICPQCGGELEVVSNLPNEELGIGRLVTHDGETVESDLVYRCQECRLSYEETSDGRLEPIS